MITKLEIYTVDTLIKDLQELSKKGLGQRVVLIPNRSNDIDADYRFLNRIDSFICDDIESKCVYLSDFTDEIENYLADINFNW